MKTKETVSEVDSLAFVKEQVGYAQMDNFGFKEVKILEGNVVALEGLYDNGRTDKSVRDKSSVKR